MAVLVREDDAVALAVVVFVVVWVLLGDVNWQWRNEPSADAVTAWFSQEMLSSQIPPTVIKPSSVLEKTALKWNEYSLTTSFTILIVLR